jgi:hypothetical protein
MMLNESDLYNSNTSPDVKVNPKSLGAMWINYSNGRHYICKDNTNNKNVWLDPIEELTNEINSLNKRIDSIKPVGLGYDQQWYDVTTERTPGVIYYNNTAKPIIVMISAADLGYSRLCVVSFVVNGLTIVTGVGDGGNEPGGSAFSVIVPIGASYQLIYNSPQIPISIWSELR